MTVNLNMKPSSLVRIGELPSGGGRWSICEDGGTFEGPGLRGRVRSGGIESPLLRTDNVLVINARWMLETDDGVPLYVLNRGFRRARSDPAKMRAWIDKSAPVETADFYFRVEAKFETPLGKYDWLTRCLVIGTLADAPASPALKHPGPSTRYYRVL